MPRHELFPFRYRDPLTGKWRNARYKAERQVIAERYTEWDTGPPMVINPDPTARYFSPWPRSPADSLPNVGQILAIARSDHALRLMIAGVAA